MQRLIRTRVCLWVVLSCTFGIAQSQTTSQLNPESQSSFEYSFFGTSERVPVLIFDSAGGDSLTSDKSYNVSLPPPELPKFAPSPGAARLASAIEPRKKSKPEGFHWKRALSESGMFLVIQHVYLARTDARWITAGTGIPFNHYWRDYMKSLDTWAHTGWDDGDPFLDNYIGHPIQGALTGYIQVQNDPKGARLEFSNTKAYWHSRLKAMAWNAAFSTQWEIGPLGEMTVEKYGTWDPWLQNGKWINGVGQVDMVVTPIGGFGWMVMEDVLDRYVARRVEGRTDNKFLVGLVRCAVNPIRGGANVLHGKWPWYRASRRSSEVYYSRQFGGH